MTSIAAMLSIRRAAPVLAAGKLQVDKLRRTHVREVEIDPETGASRIVDYWMVDDVGTVINPIEHDPEKACPGLDPGWTSVFGKACPRA